MKRPKETLKKLTAKELYAQLYDARVLDWEGEIEFYRDVTGSSPLKAHGLLEVACGTGRVALRLASDGMEVTGFDISPELLEVAQKKSRGMTHVRWVQADMRTFELEQQFGFVISPGHSFQFMTTPEEQVMCLERIRRHLVPGGLAVIHIDHQDLGWLAGLLQQKEPVFEKSEILIHPGTGEHFRRAFAWTFEPVTQTATVQTTWQKLDESENVVETWKMEPAKLHCIFPFEMEHLLKRVGFSIEAVYGDFFKGELTRDSSQMIWLAR